MAPFLNTPHGNIPPLFLVCNAVPDERLTWIDGTNMHQQVSKALGRQMTRRLADSYLSTGLGGPPAKRKNVTIFNSENQVIQFPNMLSIITAGGIVATCPWQASIGELLHRVNVLQPKAVVCFTESCEVSEQARQKSLWRFEIIMQDSSNMGVWKYSFGQPLISSKEHE
ncbi:hypothetical protein B0J13DRAFT_622840 [Dactylonectria estremocensis]|uniref:Uncharacterized protein n=1 Tax=Dactylonectria estremocensis TaxID=1079267 RepID=A0A9P9ETD7_9HYPO|nr:hypothetical protein B0J13DRAFT_622840 [Dactylonectria estremocensis]